MTVTLTVTIYGLTKCSTCVNARQWLTAHGVAHTFIDYRDQPIPAATLTDWAQQLGGWEKLVNRASMTWRNLPDARRAPANDTEWTALIADYPALVRRPVAVTPDGAVGVGFNDKRYQTRFG